MITKAETEALSHCPFSMETLAKFCGTKKGAKHLGLELGGAIKEAIKAAKMGESEDTAFELMFWDGTLFFTEDDLWEVGYDVASDLEALATETEYCEHLHADIILGEFDGRKFIAVHYDYKEEEYAWTAWWLSRKDAGL